jgi:serine/threonine-protein kinase
MTWNLPMPTGARGEQAVPASVPCGQTQAIAIPGYQIIREIARGGMGIIYEARQQSLDRPVAIKVLPRHFAQQPDLVSRFEREAKALAALSHPHIVSVYDRGRAGECSTS